MSSSNEMGNVELIKKKIISFDKLLQYKDKLEEKCRDYGKSVIEKDSLILKLKERLKETEEKIPQVAQMSSEIKKMTDTLSKMEAALGEKNIELINKEIEISKLKRELESIKEEKKLSAENDRREAAVKAMKEEYENEKWKNLATISSLRQENESLKENSAEINSYLSSLEAENKELEKYKEESTRLGKEGAHKDRQIASLSRKLDKAHSMIKKKFNDDIGPMLEDFGSQQQPESRSTEIEDKNKPPVKLVRFPFLYPGRTPRQRCSVVKYRKLAILEYCSCPLNINRNPRISDEGLRRDPPSNVDDLRSLMPRRAYKRKHYQGEDAPAAKVAKESACSTSLENDDEMIEANSAEFVPASPLIRVRNDLSFFDPTSLSEKDAYSSSDNEAMPQSTQWRLSPRKPLQNTKMAHQTLARGSPARNSQAAQNHQVSERSQVLSSAKPKLTEQRAITVAADKGGNTKAATVLSQPRSESHIAHSASSRNTTETANVNKINDACNKSFSSTVKDQKNRISVEPDEPVYINPNPPKVRRAHQPRNPPASQLELFPLSRKDVNPSSRASKASPVVPAKQQESSQPSLNKPSSTLKTKCQAKAKILEEGMRIETPKTVGTRLTAAQLAEAKNRMVGHAPSSITQRPSVDGFRASEPLVERKQAAAKQSVRQKKPGKVNEDDFSCPTRRSTLPKRVSKCIEKGTNVQQNASGSSDIVEKGHSSLNATSEPESSNQMEVDSPESRNTSNVVTALSPLVHKRAEGMEDPSQKASQENAGNESNCPDESDAYRRDSLDYDLELSDEEEGVEDTNKVDQGPKVTDAMDVDTRDIEEQKILMIKTEPQTPIEQPTPPIERKKFYATFLEELLAGATSNMADVKRQLNVKKSKLEVARKSFVYATYTETVQKNLRNLMGQQNEASLMRIVDAIANVDLEISMTVVCDHIYNELTKESRFSKLLAEENPEEPSITKMHLRLFTLIVHLDNKPKFSGIIRNVANLLYQSLLGRDRMYNMKLNSALSITRFLTLCARYLDDLELMKRFLMDIFFFKSPRNHLLVGILTDLWPDVLWPVENPLPPLHESIICLIFHTQYPSYSKEMEVNAVRNKFASLYGLSPHNFSDTALVIKYIDQGQKIKDPNLRHNLSLSLLMLGRGREHHWAHNQIMSRLLKNMRDVMSDQKSKNTSQDILRWLIETVGLISRIYPVEARDQLKVLFEPVKELITNGAMLEKETVTCCINSLLLLGYHLQVQVASFLSSWKPPFQLDAQTMKRLQDFIATRGMKHAVITRNVNANLRQKRGFRGRGTVRGRGFVRGRGAR